MFSEEMQEMFDESRDFVAVDEREELQEEIESKEECTCDLCVTRIDE